MYLEIPPPRLQPRLQSGSAYVYRESHRWLRIIKISSNSSSINAVPSTEENNKDLNSLNSLQVPLKTLTRLLLVLSHRKCRSSQVVAHVALGPLRARVELCDGDTQFVAMPRELSKPSRLWIPVSSGYYGDIPAASTGYCHLYKKECDESVLRTVDSNIYTS